MVYEEPMSGFRPCQESGSRSRIIRPANRRQNAATFQKCSSKTCEHITGCRGISRIGC